MLMYDVIVIGFGAKLVKNTRSEIIKPRKKVALDL